MNKISIITVVYNDEKRISETIKSVYNQNYNNLEYIIIDGHSSDNTIKTIKAINCKIDHLISEPDKGIYDAMNKGVKNASGDWILFLNAGDTFYNENTLSDIFNFKDLDLYDVIYGRHMWDYKSFKKESSERPLELMYKTLPFCHQASITKRTLLLKYPFNLHFKIIADYDFFRKVYFKKANFMYCPVVFVNYLCTGGVSSNNMIKLYLENFEITKDLFILTRFSRLIKNIIRYELTICVKTLLPNYLIQLIRRSI